MENLSKIRRDKMIQFLETLKEQHSDDESLIAINQIEKELVSKRYGLVWEEHEETVDVMMKDNIPVFTEVPEYEIVDAPDEGYNFLLEGDNLHSLHLLEKTHKGKVDVIYIDPPYNTGNKDFVYNDVKIDNTDGYQHSKWLSFMSRRLEIARNLLSSRGIMAISIGYQEINNLMLLCQEKFPSRQVVCITVQTASGNAVTNGFTYVQEYVIFITPLEFKPYELEDEKKEYSNPYHGMNLSGFNQTQRPNQAYPIFVDLQGQIVGCGKSLQERIDSGDYVGDKKDFNFDYNDCPEGTVAIWPITQRGDACVWRLIPDKLLQNWEKGYIKVVPKSVGRNKYTIQYLSGGIIKQIENGILEVYRKDNTIPTLEVIGFKTSASSIPTIWTNNKFLTATGSRDIKKIFNSKVAFSFPKPVPLIKEILNRVSSSDALILDFFAGSGTTAQAVLELNQEDDGTRRFILCTNNESNICEDITYQRIKTVITGKRQDGSEYSEGISANLKYYRTDFVSKDTEYLADALLEHIVEMIQLENGIKIDDKQYVLLMSDEEADELEQHWNEYSEIKAIYISQDVLLTAKQEALFSAVDMYIVPDYYFSFELREAGELW